MTLSTQALALVNSVGADIGSIIKSTGNLSTLTTTAKSSIVNAIDELVTGLNQLISNIPVIDPAVPSSSTIDSSNNINALLAQLKSDIINGASSTYDTLKEISDYITADQSGMAGMLTSLGGTVSFVDVMALTQSQQQRACANIGVGNPYIDVYLLYLLASDTNTNVTPGFVIPGYFATE